MSRTSDYYGTGAYDRSIKNRNVTDRFASVKTHSQDGGSLSQMGKSTSTKFNTIQNPENESKKTVKNWEKQKKLQTVINCWVRQDAKKYRFDEEKQKQIRYTNSENWYQPGWKNVMADMADPSARVTNTGVTGTLYPSKQGISINPEDEYQRYETVQNPLSSLDDLALINDTGS